MGVSSNGKYLPLDDFQGREAYLAAAVDGALAEDCGENCRRALFLSPQGAILRIVG